MMQSSHISVSLDIKTLIFLEEAFPTNTPAQLPHFGLFPYLKSTMQHLSADGLLPGSEDDDDGASSAEQSTEQVPAQQPEQPSQPASEPSLQEKPEDPPLRLSRHSSQQLQQHLPSSSEDPQRQPLHMDAESTAQPMASRVQSPVTDCCQEDYPMASSCSDDYQAPCSQSVLMPEDPCLLPKPDFTSSQHHPDK